jgi:phytoene dehydrogenase-like protein
MNVPKRTRAIGMLLRRFSLIAVMPLYPDPTCACLMTAFCPPSHPRRQRNARASSSAPDELIETVDIAIVGAGIGGLCAGAILNTLYGKTVGIYESHYLPGGCAHAFNRTASNGVTFTFDSGPTIVLGCSQQPFNPLRQVLNAVGQSVEWIRYDGWGMVESPTQRHEQKWKMELGPNIFERGPLAQFGGPEALQEFQELRAATYPLVAGAVEIPAMAMRAGRLALLPLLRYLPALVGLIGQGTELTQGTFAPFMDGPLYVVTDPWLRSWLDALAFSLSGLPASRTAAAAMAYVLYDMHREGAALDYPKGGLGEVIYALVRGVEQGEHGSKVHLSRHVETIDFSDDAKKAVGVTLKGGKRVIANEGVICNAPVWSLKHLIQNPQATEILNNFIPQTKEREPPTSWRVGDNKSYFIAPRSPMEEVEDSLLFKCDTAEMTGSFLHLHLAIKSDGLNLDNMEAHYTVMDRSLAGDGSTINGIVDGPAGEANMVAVSNPCVIDRDLAPQGYMVIHAYAAGNEPYAIWRDLSRTSPEYKELKEERAQVLWRAVESIIPDVRDRVVLELIGSPKTHERFLRRPMGTYGAATEDYLKDGSTPWENLVLAGDSIFPGIGVPAVALSGASAANALVSPWRQWRTMDKLKERGLL